MRKESEGVTENLLDSARKEFLQYGFHDASLRRISADSGVSTNSIYTRFGDKSGLFTAIVKEAADELMAIYSDSIKKAGEATDISRAEDAGDEGTDLVLEYIYRHQEEFKLIFCCSAGTEYETYFDRLAAKEEYYYKQFAKQFSDGGHSIDDFLSMYIAGTDGSMCMNLSHMIKAMKRQKNLWKMSEHLTMRAGRR